jgi:hypothetical protein
MWCAMTRLILSGFAVFWRMRIPPHPSVRAVHDAADMVLRRNRHVRGSFWRRLFRLSREHSFHGSVRYFAHALKLVLDVPPTMLTPEDLALLGRDVEQVVARVEAVLEQGEGQEHDEAELLAPAVYAIRERYESVFKRGATRA